MELLVKWKDSCSFTGESLTFAGSGRASTNASPPRRCSQAARLETSPFGQSAAGRGVFLSPVIQLGAAQAEGAEVARDLGGTGGVVL